MRGLGRIGGLAALVGVSVCGFLLPAKLASTAIDTDPGAAVRVVVDGDTLTLSDGRKIRLLQIDTPELGSGECYSRAAHRLLLRIVPVGTRVTLEADPRLDNRDQYGRYLRYVRKGSLNVNLELVRLGAAAPYFYRGDRGRYAAALMAAARAAKAARRGLWGACPNTVLDPSRQVDSGISGPPAGGTATTPAPVVPPIGTAPTTTEAPTTTGAAAPPPLPPTTAANCAASYPDVCIPPPPPDLDCKDVSYRRFRVIYNVPDPDPHRFDGDHDGIGCES